MCLFDHRVCIFYLRVVLVISLCLCACMGVHVYVCVSTHVCTCVFLLYCCCFGCFPVCRLYLDLMPPCKTHISKMLIQFSRKIVPSVQYKKPSLQMWALRALMPGGPIKAPTVHVSSALHLAWCIRGSVCGVWDADLPLSPSSSFPAVGWGLHVPIYKSGVIASTP